ETGQYWPLRAADMDPAGHVNNSIHWAAVEDVLAGLAAAPAAAELEYHRPILPGQHPRMVTSHEHGERGTWLLDRPPRPPSALPPTPPPPLRTPPARPCLAPGRAVIETEGLMVVRRLPP